MDSLVAKFESSAPVNLRPPFDGAKDGSRFAASDNLDEIVANTSLVIVDTRTLDRECLAQSLRSHNIRMHVTTFSSMDHWRKEQDDHPALGAILVNIGGRKATDSSVCENITQLVSEFCSIPVVVLADTDDMTQILKALECGARGYIPTSVGIDVCVEAIRLAVAGGIFVPASSVLSMRHVAEPAGQEPRPMGGMFTVRQAEVVNALRRGKANKIIAYELNLRESTVKVHIRNIMKKLKATNRTEVAYMINDLFPIDSGTYSAD
ncbi:MAG: LuxR C-terminal-related transcriptional regulator [Phyllobacterium sp.]